MAITTTSAATEKPFARARLCDALTGAPDLSLSAEQEGTKPFFIVDHGLEADFPLLVLAAQSPFKLLVSGTAPRGLLAKLARPSAQGAVQLAIADSFSSASAGVKSTAALTRWADASNGSLAVDVKAAAEWDQGTSQGHPDLKQAEPLEVSVSPLVRVDSAGVRWDRNGPLWSNEKRAELHQYLSVLPAAEMVHEGISADALDRLLSAVKDLAENVGATSGLGNVPTASSAMLDLHALGGALLAGAGTSLGSIAFPVHGPAVPASTSTPIKVVETGGTVTWSIRIMVCKTAEEMVPLRASLAGGTPR